jgi:hypothetical protein
MTTAMAVTKKQKPAQAVNHITNRMKALQMKGFFYGVMWLTIVTEKNLYDFQMYKY